MNQCYRPGCKQATVHAEQNAVFDFAKRGVKNVPYILHITLYYLL